MFPCTISAKSSVPGIPFTGIEPDSERMLAHFASLRDAAVA